MTASLLSMRGTVAKNAQLTLYQFLTPNRLRFDRQFRPAKRVPPACQSTAGIPWCHLELVEYGHW